MNEGNLGSRSRVKVIEASKNKIAQARVNHKKRTFYISDKLVRDLYYNDIHARRIFAHELGHIALGHRGDNHKFSINIRTRSSRKIEEMEADIFADHFLAANHLLQKYTSVYDVQTYFLLSFPVARRRLAEASAPRS